MEMCRRAVELVGVAGVRKEQVDRWIKKMNEEGWCRGREWFEEGVPEGGVEAGGAEADGEEGGEEDDGVRSSGKRKRRLVRDEDMEEEDPDGVVLPGLGTMMQDAVDFLSEERRVDYSDWKAGVMRRIQQMEKGKGKAVAVA